MEDGPEQICEALIFQEDRILQKADEKRVFPLEKIPELFQPFDIEHDAVFERCCLGLCFPKRFFVPTGIYQDFILQLVGIFHKVTEAPQEFHSDLAEKSSDNHIQFLKDGFFFSAGQKPFDDQEDQKNIDEQKSKIADHVEKDVMDIMKNKIVERVR
jgi:hypothetical protein